MSNYVYITKYLLTEKAYINNVNMSNYVDITSNRLVAKADLNNANMSNYVDITSNRLVVKADLNNVNMSNYVNITSNLIAQRMMNLTTDMIIENRGAMKRFIINNAYDNNLSVYGNLTITSNLIVLGARGDRKDGFCNIGHVEQGCAADLGDMRDGLRAS